MCKKITVGVLVALACLWAVRKTHVLSYASTIVTSGQEHFRKQIPRELELARVRNEIQNLDRDYQALFGPVAERTAAVKRLERQVVAGTANLTHQREALLAFTKAVEAKETQISFNGSTYCLPEAKNKLAYNFAFFKKQQADLTVKEKQLEAERACLAATKDQLDKLMTQKREFETRLLNLEAEEATLAVVATKIPLPSDNSRVADIDQTLKYIAESQELENERRTIQQQYGSKIGDASPSATQSPAVDYQEIRDYLEGRTSTGTSKVVKSN
jgi:chromosome segregation ATPase